MNFKKYKGEHYCTNCGRSRLKHKNIYCFPFPKEKYNGLLKAGFLFEFYPNFSGNYEEDVLEHDEEK